MTKNYSKERTNLPISDLVHHGSEKIRKWCPFMDGACIQNCALYVMPMSDTKDAEGDCCFKAIGYELWRIGYTIEMLRREP